MTRLLTLLSLAFAARAQKLQVGVPGPSGLDPHFLFYGPNMAAARYIFDSFVGRDADTSPQTKAAHASPWAPAPTASSACTMGTAPPPGPGRRRPSHTPAARAASWLGGAQRLRRVPERRHREANIRLVMRQRDV